MSKDAEYTDVIEGIQFTHHWIYEDGEWELDSVTSPRVNPVGAVHQEVVDWNEWEVSGESLVDALWAKRETDMHNLAAEDEEEEESDD